MGQPVFVPGVKGVNAKFGNAALPNGQGVMSWVDLNDRTTWQVDGVTVNPAPKQLASAGLLYRGRGVWLSEDYGPRALTLSCRYLEQSGVSFGAALAKLTQAGEQFLTFDGGTTAIRAKLANSSGRHALTDFWPFLWGVDLEFLAANPWFFDVAATAMAPVTIVTDSGQAFAIVYAGSIWAEPIWTIVIPVGNAVPINSMQLKNTMSGEFLTVNFLSVAAIPAATARTITIDCAAMTATDNLGNSYDTYGSFPMLYPPAGQSNAFSVIIVPASGASSGITIACSHNPRWEL